MRKCLRAIGFVWALAILGGSTGFADQGGEPEGGKVPAFDRVVYVIFENTNQAVAAAQPYFKSLLSRGGSLQNHFGTARPSQPNYISMISGATYNVITNSNVNLEGRHIGDLLEERGKTWKAYGEGYPGNCFTGGTYNGYARKHLPFMSFNNVRTRPERCAHIRPAQEFYTDLAQGTLPHFSMYVPDNKNSGHDTGVGYADQWFSKTWGPILSNLDSYPGTLFVVTFDEAGNDWRNKIYTVLLGDKVKPGSQFTGKSNHHSLLRTVEDALGLDRLGTGDATSLSIGDIWL